MSEAKVRRLPYPVERSRRLFARRKAAAGLEAGGDQDGDVSLSVVVPVRRGRKGGGHCG